MSINQALIIHCAVASAAICVFAAIFWRRGLFTILHTGPWVLLACSLYFVYNPAVSLLNDDLFYYKDALMIFTREGSSRVFWILGTFLTGLTTFVLFYVRHRTRKSEAALKQAPVYMGRWSAPQILVLSLFFLAAMYSILYLRVKGQFVDSTVEVEFDRGMIVGGATGYSVVAHGFFLFIVVLLLYRGPRWARLIGMALGIGFVALRLYDTHDRSSIVTLMAATGMAFLALGGMNLRGARFAAGFANKNRIKTAVLMISAVGMTLFLIARGHESVAEVERIDWERGQESLRRSDTAMLPTLYAWSWAYERHGYDYGLPLVNRALFGWIPRRFAPWKDDLPWEILGREDLRYKRRHEKWFIGPKATIIGSFYAHGGVIGVLIGMALLGVLTKRLDRLVAAGRTDMGRVIGIVWMAGAWMMFGSGDGWVVSSMFISAIPFIGLWMVSKIEGRKRTATGLAPVPRR